MTEAPISPPEPTPSPEQKRSIRDRLKALKKKDRASAVPKDAPDTPKLRPLTPAYDETHHSIYATALEDALTGPNASDIHNIALTGGYGSGKSSVLQKVIEDHQGEIVQISLSTLGAAKPKQDTSTSADAAKAETPTNRIQKEIVKQLLYQELPRHMPGSRYKRLARLPIGRSISIAVVTGLIVALTSYLTGVSDKLALLAIPIKLTSLQTNGVVWLLSSVVVFVILLLAHNRLILEKFSAGSATISLSSKSETFFDEYLDEIVYFFEITGKTIVVFEDIDRFNEPYIFETLRSLNTLLNSARQLGKKHNIRFIYAIRDSVFDEISRREAAEEYPEVDLARLDRVAVENARANRTKFFDIVVPVVPFVTHLNARDLMLREMDGLQPALDPAVIDIAARHIVDMRMIIEARNEYIVFSKVVLDDEKNALRLRRESLFALMLYKTTHLADFEKIRFGESNLDELYRQRGTLVSQNLQRLSAAATQIRRDRRAMRGAATLASGLGDRLVQYATRAAAHQTSVDLSGQARTQVSFVLNGQRYDADAVHTPTFWETYAAQPSAMQATVQNPQYGAWNVTLIPEDIDHYIGNVLPTKLWSDAEDARLQGELEMIAKQRTFLNHATMQQLAAAQYVVTFDGESLTFAGLMARLVPSELTRQLITAGYIDANFTLYTSKYYGDRVSVRASNFILHHIEQDVIDVTFELRDEDVEAILRERGEEILRDRTLYNVDVLNYLLRTKHPRADWLIVRLALAGEDELQLIRTYFVEGSEKADFARRLAKHWRGIYAFIANDIDADEATSVSLFDAALHGITSDVDYDVSDAIRQMLEAHYTEMPALTGDLDRASAMQVVELAQDNDATFTDLRPLSDAARSHVIEHGLYPVTRSNLEAAVPDSAGLALDQLRAKSKAVYEHALDQGGSYLAALDDREPTIASQEGFAGVVEETLSRASSLLPEIVTRAASGLALQTISGVSEAAWPALAAADRFPATFENVAAYVGEATTVDEPLAGLLTRVGFVTIEEGDAAEGRKRLALVIVRSAVTISDPAMRVQLARSLEPPVPLPLAEIPAEPGQLVGLLLLAGLIDDDEDAFVHVAHLSWATREFVIHASKEFAGYMTTTEVPSSTVRPLLESSLVSADVQRAVVARSAEFAAPGDSTALAAVATYASEHHIRVTTSELTRMAVSRVPAELVVALLEAELAAITEAEVVTLLTAVGGPYASLVERRAKRPQIPDTPPNQKLVERLVDLQFVSTHATASGMITVNTRKQ